jgi:hypothetical protein
MFKDRKEVADPVEDGVHCKAIVLVTPQGGERSLSVKPFIIIQPVDFCDFPLIRSTADAAAKIHYSIAPYCMCDSHAMQCICTKRQSHETAIRLASLRVACFVCLHDASPRRPFALAHNRVKALTLLYQP